jgi:SNF2 family DNA or RNA helicase
MQIISDQLKKFKFNRDVENMRKFGSYLLAIICYLRQCIISPILPIANIALDMSDFQNKSELSQILLTEIKKLNIDDWLNDENSVKSTRMTEALKIVDKHESDNIVIFMCFRTSLDIFKTFLKDDRKIYTISGTMSSIKRSETLEKFKKKSDNGKGNILLLTYEIGSEGLNLQISNTVLLVDFFWNDGKTKQAIARILRYGQLSPVVNIYLFTSNTAIEKAMFEKHDLKLTILKELSEGTSKTKLKTMNVNEIIKIVNTEENINAIDKINSKY